MTNNTNDVFDEIIKTLDIPDSAYEKAESRYKDLGEWFSRPEAMCEKFSPHIYPQGSFRLGTVVRPLMEDDDYDLDLGCRLRLGVTKATHSQAELKAMVGKDMEAYRLARNISNPLDEKHRCWRLEYADELCFHMDTVPSIPEELQRTMLLVEDMVKVGSSRDLAQDVAKHAGAITDNRLPGYSTINPHWLISNSEGYAIWFESRVKLAMPLLEKRAFDAKAAKIDDLPARRWKAPLQQVVQILKRHRDVMFKDDPEGQPISIIITTLAAEAYAGEQDVSSALKRVLNEMGGKIRTTSPRVPNPVNPAEDFADKWGKAEYARLRLEQKFRQWLLQAQTDFDVISKQANPAFLAEQANIKFASTINPKNLEEKWGAASPSVVTTSKSYTIEPNPPRPWLAL